MRTAIVTLSLALVATASCFTPKFDDGIACDNGACPPGFTCGSDNTCHSNGGPVADAATDGPVNKPNDSGIDAPPASDAAPDAMPVECTSNADCQAPPSMCLEAGTCNTTTNQCEFPPVDCSGMDTSCTKGTCNPTTGACEAAPSNEGNGCGAGTVCGGFGSCGSFSDTCDESGMKSRTCHDFTCVSGVCSQGADYQDSTGCTRDQTGVTCNTAPPTGCDTCGGFSDTCDESGTQTCTCTDFTCLSGSCVSSSSTCTQGCTRSSRDGITCSPTTTSGCGSCNYSDVCDESASQSCTCTDHKCSNQSCATSTRSCTQSCARNTDGDVCNFIACGSTGKFHDECCSAGACTQSCSACQ